jgi:signal peptidase I
VAQPPSVRREILSGALLIVTFVFQVARVDGLSMEPTLKGHDRLIVNRLTYRGVPDSQVARPLL